MLPTRAVKANRNPSITEPEMEAEYSKLLGVKVAAQILQSVFPKRKIVLIDTLAVNLGKGRTGLSV
ncbi:hypothetical protein CLV98_102259 [Dyadobacter jejuensis]|uniref:Uncharacterized protein n=1 Tax=Dyadobacter jejuensis TaxID=1082580 RepID=A0A316APS6_9BACT|nr:hypothetical protein [Dyadobacter jejuensis]PWJ59426.1 hypothetical protein CLV98_102259 [Dyadobacter jejuensis]